MTQEYLDKLQKKTLETLKFTIDFFNKHNLRYFACGGTCLGAVRHHGIIPWDDDVDLFMPYDDYQKLLSLKAEIDNTPDYKLLTPETPGYYDPVCRITDKGTTIWRNYINPIVFGTQTFLAWLSRSVWESITLSSVSGRRMRERTMRLVFGYFSLT